MSSRLAGAFLALTAAALLVTSIATSAWWAGHPEVAGRTITAKDVHVGLIGATGCNTGGNGECTTLELPEAFTITGYVGLGTSSLLVLLLILVVITTLKATEGRKLLAKLAIASALLSAVVAIALVVQGPKMTSAQHVTLPIGYGLFLFAGAIASTIVGSLIAMRPTPPLQLRPNRQPIAPNLAAPPIAPPIDPLALLHQQPAPAPAPAPLAAYGTPVPPSPGGILAGPAGPLGAAGAPGGPQLRPLYDAAPAQGGTGGYVPTPTPPPAMSTPTSPQPGAPPRARSSSVPPPPRARSSSVPPPPVRPAPPPTRTKAMSVPPPPPRLKAATMPPRPKAASIAPPVPRSPTKSPPKIAASVVPPPVMPPAPPLVAAQLPGRAETDPADQLETVDRAAMAGDHDAAAEPAESIGDRTDVSVPLPPAATAEQEAPDRPATETADVETVAYDKPSARSLAEAPARPSASELETTAHQRVDADELVAAVARESASEIETIAREKLSAAELETGDSTSPATMRAVTEVPAAAVAAPTAVKVPVSTAPESLPPPSDESTPVPSGPSPPCPQCEAPMAWVEEHLRFFCRSCRMYF